MYGLKELKMRTCDRCGQDGAVRMTLGFKIKDKENRHIEKKDVCVNCMVNLVVRLLDQLPSDEKIRFFQQFMNGIII